METNLFKDYPEIMTVDEVAKCLRISFSTAYQMAQRGSLPGFKVGRQWRFYKSDIEKFLNSASPITTRPQAIRRGSVIFDSLILMRYRYHPHQVKDTPQGGWVLMRTIEEDKTSAVVKIRFRKIRLTDGKMAIVLSPRAFKRIPENQRERWEKMKIR